MKHTKELALSLLLVGSAAVHAGLSLGGSVAPAAAEPDPAPSDAEVARQVSGAIQSVARAVQPAVVGISSYARQRPPLTGSGVILTEDGLVVTNNHVVAGGQNVLVRLLDGRTLPATVRGTDPESDLALLDIEGEGFHHAELSEDGPPAIGTWVVAIGNPIGLDHTVTFGIISARGRSGIDIATYEDFLQTDAAINSGNSGGPLLDLEGRVVGINTAIEVISRGSQGLGFAIPAYMVREVVEDLSEKGYVERGYFGIQVREMGPRESSEAGLGEARHVRIRNVVDGTPAARAGLRVDDVLLHIDGAAIESSREVFDAIARLDPGTEVGVEVWRDGRRTELRIDVGDRSVQSAND